MTEKPSIVDLSEFLKGNQQPPASAIQSQSPSKAEPVDLSEYLSSPPAAPVESSIPASTADIVEPAEQEVATDPIQDPVLDLLVEEPAFDQKKGILNSVIEFGKETFTSFQRANASENALEKLGGLVDYVESGEIIPELIAAEYADLINTRAELGENAIIQKIAESDDVAEALTAAFQNSDAIFQTIVEQYPDIIEEVGASVAGGLTGGVGGTFVAGPAGTVVGAVGGAASAGAVVAKSNAYRSYLQGKIQGHLQTRGLQINGANISAFMNSGEGAEAMDKASTYSSVIAATSAAAGLVGGGAITSTLGKLAGKLGLEVAEEGGKIVVREGIRRKAGEFVASTAIELGGEVAASASVGEDVTYGELILELGASSIQSGVSGAIGVAARRKAGSAVDDVTPRARIEPSLVDTPPVAAEPVTYTPKTKASWKREVDANRRRDQLRADNPESNFETQAADNGDGHIVVETPGVNTTQSAPSSDTDIIIAPAASPTAGKPADALRANKLSTDEAPSSPLVTFDDFARISDGKGKKFDSPERRNPNVDSLSDDQVAAEQSQLQSELLKARNTLDDPQKNSTLSDQEKQDLSSRVSEINSRLSELPKKKNKVSQYLANSEVLAGFKKKIRRNVLSNAPTAARTATISYKSDFASGQNVVEFHRKNFEKIAQEVSKDFSSAKEFELSYEDLYNNIMVDTDQNVQFRLDDSVLPDNFDPSTDPITPDMILYNKDGSIPLTITNTKDPSITSEYAIDKRFAPIMEPIIKYKANTFRFIKEKLAVPRIAQLERMVAVRLVDQREKMAAMMTKIEGPLELEHSGFKDKANWFTSFVTNEGLDDDVQGLVDQGIISDTSYPEAELLLWLQDNTEEDISFDKPNADGPYEVFLDSMSAATSLEQFHQLSGGIFQNEDGSTPIAIHAALGGFNNDSPISKSYKSLMAVSVDIFNASRNIDFYDKITLDNSAHISSVFRSQMGGVNSKEWYAEVRSPRKGSEAEARVNAYKAELQQEILSNKANKDKYEGNPALLQKAVDAKYKMKYQALDPSIRPEGAGNEVNIFKFESADGSSKSAGGSIFARKSNMSAVEKAWRGEVKDVGIAFANMQQLFTQYKAQAEYASQLTKIFMDSDNPTMFRSQKLAEDAGYVDTVAVDFPDIYNSNSLKKVYVTPELEDFFVFNSQVPMTNSFLEKTLGGVNQVTKVLLTIPNLSLAAANAISNATLLTAVTPFLTNDVSGSRKGVTFMVDSMMDVARTVGNVPPELESEADIWVAGTAALAGDIEAQKRLGDFLGAVGDFIDGTYDKAKRPAQEALSSREQLVSDPSILRKVDDSKFRQRAEGMALTQTFLINLHRAPEVAMQKFTAKVFKEYAINRWEMTEADATSFAREQLRTIGVNILNNPRVIQQIQNAPTGTFTGWFTSLMVSSLSMPRQMLRMHKMDMLYTGRKHYGPNFDPSTSPKEQVSSVKREVLSGASSASRGVASGALALAAPAAVTSMLYAASTSIMDAFDDDEEERLQASTNMDAFRTLTYPNMKNRDFKIVEQSADGRFTSYIDQTRLNSVGWVQETFNAVKNAEAGDDLSNVLGDIVEPTTGVYTTLGFGFETVSQTFMGIDQYGNSLSPIGADVSERVGDSVGHLAKNTFNTSYMRGANEGIQQLINENRVSEKTGERSDIKDTILGFQGLRIAKQDNALMLAQKASVSLININQAQTELADTIIKRNIVSDEDISHQLRGMKDVHAREMSKVIEYKNAGLAMGMSYSLVKEFLGEKTGLSAGDLKLIMRDEIPVYKLSEGFGRKKLEKLQGKTPGVASNPNLSANIKRARSLLNDIN